MLGTGARYQRLLPAATRTHPGGQRPGDPPQGRTASGPGRRVEMSVELARMAPHDRARRRSPYPTPRHQPSHGNLRRYIRSEQSIDLPPHFCTENRAEGLPPPPQRAVPDPRREKRISSEPPHSLSADCRCLMMVSVAGGLCPFGQWERIVPACSTRVLQFSDFCNSSLRAKVVFLCEGRPDLPGALLRRSRRVSTAAVLRSNASPRP